MRQTGRTSRIIDFVVGQLFSIGRCIATDHIVFEYDKTSQINVKHFIERVERRISIDSHGRMKVNSKIIKVDDVYMVDFKLSPIES
jgi:hypothetical protein